MTSLQAETAKAKDRLVLTVWLCILVLGFLLSFASYSLWPDLNIPYCRSSEAGTAPAAIYFLAMYFCVVPLLLARNRRAHREHAQKTVIALKSTTGLISLLSFVSLVLVLLPYLLICENDAQYGRAALATRALKASWLSLGFSGALLALGIYIAAIILFVYIPSIRAQFNNHRNAP